MKHKFLLLYVWFVRTILYFFPDIPVIMRFRGWLYGIGMIKCGTNFQVTHNSIIKGIENFDIGNHVFVGNQTIIMGSGGVEIDDEVMFGPNVVCVSGNHSRNKQSFRYGKIDKGFIRIGAGAWIGANSTLAMGAVIPESAVVGANSFVSKKLYQSNALYVGVPVTMKMLLKN